MQLASRFGHVNQIRRDRPLTREELMQVVPSVFGEDKHTSRSENYTWIPTITVLESPCARPGPPGIHQTHAASAP